MFDQAAERAAAQNWSDGIRGEFALALSGPFAIFRDKVMDELKMTFEQRQKLAARFKVQKTETGAFFDTIDAGLLKGEKPADRNEKIAEHRKEAHKKLAPFLKETLQPEQLKRFRQINIRSEGLFGLAEADRAEVLKELKLDEEQQRKLTSRAQELQEAVAAAKFPEGMRSVRKIRREQNDKVQAILTEAQKKQWQEILGQPFELNID